MSDESDDWNEEEEKVENPLGQYEGERDHLNRRHGEGRMLFANDDYYEGLYKKGLRHGKGLYVFTTRGGARYCGDYRFGLRSGRGTFTYPDGTKYEGEWKRNTPHGHGTYFYVNGDTYSGAWFKGQRHGIGTYTYVALEVKTVCMWDKDEMVGGGRIEYPMSGVVFHGSFQQHRPLGKGVFVFPRLGCMQLGVYEKGATAPSEGALEDDEEGEEESSKPAIEPPSVWIAEDIVAYDASLVPPLPEPRPLPVTPDNVSEKSASLLMENSEEGAWSEQDQLDEEEELSVAEFRRDEDVMSMMAGLGEDENMGH